MKRKLFLGLLVFLPLLSFFGYQYSDAQELGTELPYHQYLPLVYNLQRIEVVGPSGGNVESFIIDYDNPDVMYAGTWGSGVYKTVNGGENWVVASKGISNPFIYSLAIDPTNHHIIYAGTYGGGIFKSLDAGETWISISSGLNMPAVIYVITIDNNNPSVIYAGTRYYYSGTFGPDYGGGIYKSSNGGSSWTHISLPGNTDYVYDIKIDPNNSNKVYAAMHWTGIFKSDNAGSTWFPINNGLTPNTDAVRTREIEIDPTNSSRLFLATWGTSSLYYSTDGGNNWTPRNSGLPNDARVWELTMDAKSPNVLYASTINNGLYKTMNGGSSWYWLATLSSFHNTLVIHPIDSQTLFAGLKIDGLKKTTNGGTSWSSIDDDIHANIIVSALNDPHNPEIIYISVYGKGVWKSIDNGKTWASSNNGIPDNYVNTVIFDPSDPTKLFAGVRNNGVYYSNNGGVSWSPRNIGVPVITRSESLTDRYLPDYTSPSNILWNLEAQEDVMFDSLEPGNRDADRATIATVNTIAINPNNPNVMLIGTDGKGILRSMNAGLNWQSTEYGHLKYYASIIDPASPVRAFVGMGYPYALTRNVDDSLNFDPNLFYWDVSNTGIENQKVNSIIINNNGASTVYVAASDDPLYPEWTFSNGVFKSPSYGGDWLNIGLTEYDVISLLNHPLNPTWIIAGTTNGLFMSKDDGVSWNVFNPSIWNQSVIFLGQGFGNNLLLLGTDGGNLVLIKR